MNLQEIIEAIKKRWLEYSTNPPAHHVPRLSTATPEKDRGLMMQALLFWKFVRESINFMNHTGEEQTSYDGYTYNALKRAFLQEFICDDNKYIMYIVYIESMPTSIWRKMLWRYNIDFQSYESCLRRLSYDQICHIMNNYNDLFTTGKKPRVLKLSLRDRITFAFKKNLNQTLMEEYLFDKDRYVSKAAWAYSLLGLDFGFGKYPNGVDSDFELQDRKLSRFLSTKNHINDFVVNQEDNGLYWLLYKTARKNFVWKSWSKKEVQLKSHICPGFWATLILHLIFWVISPLIFINGAQDLISHHFHLSWYNAIFLAIGCITPLWLIAATGIVLFYIIAGIFYLIFAVLIGEKRLNAYKEWMENIGSRGIIAIAVVIVAGLIIKFIYWLPLNWLEHTYLVRFGYTSELAFIMTSLVVSSVLINALEYHGAMEYPKGKKYEWTPFIWAVTIVYVLFIAVAAHLFAVINAIRSILHYGKKFFIWLGHLFADLGIYIWEHRIGTFLVIMGVITAVTIWRLVQQVSAMEDRKAQKTEKLSYGLFFFWIVASFAYAANYGGEFHYGTFFRGVGGVFAFTAIGMLILHLMMRRNLREDKVMLREQVKNDVLAYYSNCFRKLSIIEVRHILGMAYLHNSWFTKGDKKDIAEKLETVSNIAEVLVYNSRRPDKTSDDYLKMTMRSLVSIILINFDETLLKILQRTHKQLAQNMNVDELVKYCEILVTTKSLGTAKKSYKALIGEEKKKKEQKKENWIAFVKGVKWFFYPITWLYNTVREKKDDLKMLYKLFNERCPYVNKGKQLET